MSQSEVNLSLEELCHGSDSSDSSSKIPATQDSGRIDRFVLPTKNIKTRADLTQFLESQALQSYLDFIERMTLAITDKKVSDEYYISPTIRTITSFYNMLAVWIDEIPPVKQPMRFGNTAFRTWLTKVIKHADDMMRELLPEDLKDASLELAAYWIEAFGSQVRIDYGTGHEMFMVTWYFLLEILGILKAADATAVILQCFNQYMILMRKLQLVYRLEPAGSHGVWSLDDYNALPLLFGASQLKKNYHITPSFIRNLALVDQLADDYLYFSSIKFIHKMKTGPFGEHSPILAQSSEAENWEKVYNGISKIYYKEVLQSFPVMQHFLFGSILSFEPRKEVQPTETQN